MIPSFSTNRQFLEPQKGGEKAYALLLKALSGTGKIGIAKVVISSREHLAAVKPDGLFLILELMHFAQEILTAESLKSGADKELSPRELDMAHALIESMTATWEPEKYHDEYRAAVMEMIEKKAQNLELTEGPVKSHHPGNVVDLLSVLQESLNKNRDLRKPQAKPSTKSPRAARASASAPGRSRRKVAA